MADRNDKTEYENLLRDEDAVVYPEEKSSSQPEKELHLLTAMLNRNKELLGNEDQEVDREKIDQLMRATEDFRQKVSADYKAKRRRRRFIILSTVLPAAACFVIMFALFYRGGFFTDTPAFAPRGTPVAYLMDVTGQVKIKTDGEFSMAGSGSIPLKASTSIKLADGASAAVAYPDGIFHLTEKGLYEIGKATGATVGAATGALTGKIVAKKFRDKALKPVIKSATEEADESFFISPETMLATVTASVMRSSEGTTILSPNGRTLSLEPEIITGADEEKTYTVTITSDTGAEFAPYEFTGYRLNWGDTGWRQLSYGTVYKLTLSRDGEILTVPAQEFRTVDADEADIITARIESLEQVLSSKEALMFAKANVLYNHGCYAEARMLAQKLHKQEPGNPLYLKLMQHCYKKLDMPQAVSAVQEKLDKLTRNN